MECQERYKQGRCCVGAWRAEHVCSRGARSLGTWAIIHKFQVLGALCPGRLSGAPIRSFDRIIIATILNTYGMTYNYLLMMIISMDGFYKEKDNNK